MKVKIVRIGNSKGLRLPKPVIDQVGLAEEAELEVRDGEIVISPPKQARVGWAAAAQALANRHEDELLDRQVPTRFDKQEWEW